MATRKAQITPPPADDQVTAQTPLIPPALPRLGAVVRVLPAEGCTLINNETGALFSATEPASVTVTTTIQRRLLDADLVLVT